MQSELGLGFGPSDASVKGDREGSSWGDALSLPAPLPMAETKMRKVARPRCAPGAGRTNPGGPLNINQACIVY